MKKITSLFAVLAMLATLFVVPVSAETTGYAGGNGLTAETAYEIATAEQLAYAATKINDGTDNTKYFKLTADIDYNNQEWVPMGNSTNYFQGSFDGQGHIVSNISITGDALAYDAVGFFGYVGSNADGTEIKDLGLEGMTISFKGKTAKYVGGMVGYLHAYSTISNCYVKNSSVCYATNYEANGELAIGSFAGLVRTLHGATTATGAPVIQNCYTYKVELRSAVDRVLCGFAGYMYGNYAGKFINCYAAELTYHTDGVNTGNASGSKSTVYGFLNNRGLTGIEATNCYSTLAGGQGYTDITYNSANASGVVGASQETIENAFKDVEGFAVTSEVNGGYPCFTREIPADNPLYAAGTGTEERPYEIATAEHLANAAKQINAGVDNKAYFKLTADIDYNGQEWEPMGNKTNYFQGNFDGQGHVVKNFAVTGATSYDAIGLFGYVGYGNTQTVIKNIGVEDSNIYFSGKTANYVGGMVGYLHANTTISNCYVKNSTVGYAGNYEAIGGLAIGGFAGLVRNLQGATTDTTAPIIENCYVYGVTYRQAADRELSGFAGQMYASYAAKFRNCYVADAKWHENFINTNNASGVRSTVYGFLNNAGYTGIEVTNCYSTIAGGQGSSTTYNAANAAGNVGAAKSAIVDYFKTVDGFAVSPAVNGGYPCFADEVPFKVTSVDSSNGTVKIARKAGVTTPATVYVATYEANDRLVDVATATVNDDDFTFTPVGLVSGAKIKAFVWGANNNPLTYVD